MKYNSSILGGGVDGAIHGAGSKVILDECIEIRNKQGGCKTGEAVITTAGKLPAKYVIHTVRPVWRSGNNDEEQLLANCYINSLTVAVENLRETWGEKYPLAIRTWRANCNEISTFFKYPMKCVK